MTMLFSKSCEYAIQALLYLAYKEEGRPVLSREISDALHIPHHFLNKILQQLTREGILESHRGVAGGFSLGRHGGETTLGGIVKAVDGDPFPCECVLGFPGCGEKYPCPVHDQWKLAKQIILNMMSAKSVAELSKEMDGKLDFIQDMRRA
jgi:Rrf2 family protein